MKKKISKLVALIMATLIIFSSFSVMALTEGTAYNYTTKYLNAYYNTGDWQTANGHNHNNYGQVSLRNLKSTGEPLYCIQIYNACDNSAATAENIKNTILWNNELSETARRGITRVSIYGYPNYSYGYSADNAQLATTVLIWEFEIGKRTDYSTTVTSFASEIFSNYPDAKKCYVEILKACSEHTNVPKFNTTKIALKGSGSSNAVTITDTNGVLSSFNVTSSNNKIKVSTSGNNLTVYATENGKLSTSLMLTKKKTDINSSFALTGANQILFYGTIADPITKILTVELTTGNIEISKSSEDGSISNIEFTVSGNGVNKTVKTNSSGKVTISDLPEGTYTVTENTADKYIAQKSKSVKVTAGETTNISFSNTLVKGTIKIEKYGEILKSITQNEDGTLSPIYEYQYLPNAEFKIYAAENITSGNISVAKGTLVDTVVTNSKGVATSKLLYLKSNGTAKYKIVETKAPSGYVLDTSEHIVTLSMSETGINTSKTLKLYNSRQKAKVTFSKSLENDESFNIGSNKEINKVVFGLYAQNKITAVDGTSINANDLIERISVNDNSFSVNTDLPYGNYYIQEISTDKHYILNTTKYPFSFNYTNMNDAVVNIEINNSESIKNELIRGSIKGTKIDDNGKALQGAVIGLFNADEEIFNTSTALMTTSSSEDGSFSFERIPYGSYIVKELEAPEGYLIDTNNYKVSINENDEIITIDIVDVIIRGSIRGKKIDDNGKALQGAVIGLFNADEEIFNTSTALMTTSSSEDGSFSFERIPYGSYIVKELKAPEGYLIDTNNYKVSINENDEIITIDIVDLIIRGSIRGKKVDTLNRALPGAVIGLFNADETTFDTSTALMTTSSSEDGSFSFERIPYGSYIVKELKAPKGYALDGKEYHILIVDNEQTVLVKITNSRLLGFLSLKYDYVASAHTGTNCLYIAIAISLITAICITFYFKRKGELI